MLEEQVFTLEEKKFESELTEKLISLGWEQIPNISREDSREVFDFVVLENQIKLINNISDDLAIDAINQIKRINDTLSIMNREAWKILVEGIKVYDKQSDLTKTLKLISKDSKKINIRLLDS